ncbi:MAG: tyrosine-type recombinase/integrase [Raoultibacter sp.]
MKTNRKTCGSLPFFSLTYEFLMHYLPHQLGRSPDTVESYRDALTIFRRFVLEKVGLTIAAMTFGDCNRDLALSFLEHLRQQGCSAGTCNQRLAALKSYLWYASETDIAVQSVALSISRIPPVKGPKKIKEKLSEQDLSALLAQPDPSRKIGVRDRTIMVLMYDSAIRLSELLGLDIGSVYLNDEPRIYVVGKGSKERMIAVSDATAEHIASYITLFHGSTVCPDDPLFFTKNKGVMGRMSESNVQRFIQRYADLARNSCPDIPEKVHPHMLRRTRATDLYQSGVALELVSRILGHNKVETTKIYAKPSMKMMREAMENAYLPSKCEAPAWVGNEDELARLCGLR